MKGIVVSLILIGLCVHCSAQIKTFQSRQSFSGYVDSTCGQGAGTLDISPIDIQSDAFVQIGKQTGFEDNISYSFKGDSLRVWSHPDKAPSVETLVKIKGTGLSLMVVKSMLYVLTADKPQNPFGSTLTLSAYSLTKPDSPELMTFFKVSGNNGIFSFDGQFILLIGYRKCASKLQPWYSDRDGKTSFLSSNQTFYNAGDALTNPAYFVVAKLNIQNWFGSYEVTSFIGEANGFIYPTSGQIYFTSTSKPTAQAPAGLPGVTTIINFNYMVYPMAFQAAIKLDGVLSKTGLNRQRGDLKVVLNEGTAFLNAQIDQKNSWSGSIKDNMKGTFSIYGLTVDKLTVNCKVEHVGIFEEQTLTQYYLSSSALVFDKERVIAFRVSTPSLFRWLSAFKLGGSYQVVKRVNGYSLAAFGNGPNGFSRIALISVYYLPRIAETASYTGSQADIPFSYSDAFAVNEYSKMIIAPVTIKSTVNGVRVFRFASGSATIQLLKEFNLVGSFPEATFQRTQVTSTRFSPNGFLSESECVDLYVNQSDLKEQAKLRCGPVLTPITPEARAVMLTNAVKFQAQFRGPRFASVMFNSTDLNIKGWVAFDQSSPVSSTKIRVYVTGLVPESEHGVHAHEFADMSNGCASMGPHYNPFGSTHGSLVSILRHIGDLGSLKADSKGTMKIDLSTQISLLYFPFSVIGHGLVLHSKADDLGLGGNPDSLLTGNSGTRLACGAIGLAQAFLQFPSE